MNQNYKWFVVRAKPRKEELARLHLSNQGLAVYYPQMRCTIRHARKVSEVKRPVFPGYLFVHLDPADCDWTAISSTQGVLHPIHFGSHYPAVPDWVIDSLRNGEDEQQLISAADLSRENFTPGCAVEIEVAGAEPTKGFFCDFSGQHNVRVLLNILNRAVRTTVPLNRVRPV